ncbi:hypothetical protein G9A89_017608 [Geosiphon pyriformis]|nr:hypothetical protein G9A89_017608 [Geosiphon pyriformis]
MDNVKDLKKELYNILQDSSEILGYNSNLRNKYGEREKDFNREMERWDQERKKWCQNLVAQKVSSKKITELEYIKDELTSKVNELELLKSESVIGGGNEEQRKQRKQSFESLTHPIVPTIKNIMNSKEQGLESPIHDISTISKPRKNLHEFFHKNLLYRIQSNVSSDISVVGKKAVPIIASIFMSPLFFTLLVIAVVYYMILKRIWNEKKGRAKWEAEHHFSRNSFEALPLSGCVLACSNACIRASFCLRLPLSISDHMRRKNFSCKSRFSTCYVSLYNKRFLTFLSLYGKFIQDVSIVCAFRETIEELSSKIEEKLAVKTVDNAWKCEEEMSCLSSDSDLFNTILFTGLPSGDQSAEVQVERSHLPSGGELSTCKGKPPSFVWSSDSKLVANFSLPTLSMRSSDGG